MPIAGKFLQLPKNVLENCAISSVLAYIFTRVNGNIIYYSLNITIINIMIFIIIDWLIKRHGKHRIYLYSKSLRFLSKKTFQVYS